MAAECRESAPNDNSAADSTASDLLEAAQAMGSSKLACDCRAVLLACFPVGLPGRLKRSRRRRRRADRHGRRGSVARQL